MMFKRKMIDGKEVVIGDKTYIVPPLNFASLKKLQPTLNTLSLQTDNIDINALAEVIQVAISRNYPRIKKKTIVKNLDLKNFKTIIDSIMEASGLKSAGEPNREVNQ